MGVLEFVQVLVAIILGLGIAEILRGFADFLRPSERKISLLPLAMSTWILLLHIQFWWAGWRMVGVESWHYYDLLFYLSGPIVLFLLARLSFPNDSEPQGLSEYYSSISSRIWYLTSAFFAFAVAFNVTLLDVPLFSAGPISQIALFCFAVVCANTPKHTVHAVGVVALLSQSFWRGISSVVGA